MTAAWLAMVLVIATGLASAGFDLFQKILAKWLDPVAMVFWLGLASIPLFLAGVAIRGWPEVSDGYWLPAVVSIALNLGGHIAFVQAVKISELSKTVPLLSLTPVFTALLGAALLGESPGWTGAVGIGLVVLGAFWLHADQGDSVTGWLRLLREPGAWLMIGTAFAWSVTIPLDKMAVASSEAMFHGLVLTAGMTLGAAIMLGARRGRRPDLPRPVDARIFLATLFLCVAALSFQLLALTQTLASVVETGKRGIANLMAVALGRVVLQERLDPRKIGSVATMVAGVALLLFGSP